MQLIVRSFLPAMIAAAASPAIAQYAQWTGSDLSVGKGYDTFLRKARGRCVAIDRRAPVPVSGEDLTFELRSVESESSLFNKLGISVAAKYAPFSGDGSYERETSINRYSVFFFISGNIQVRKESATAADLNPPTLDPARRKQLERRDIAGFRDKCGDTYISGMSYGGRYIALVEIATQKDSEIEAVRAAVSGAAGPFSGQAAAEARLEAATKNRKVNIRVLRGAGDGAIVPQTIPDLALAITKFPESLRDLPNRKLQPFEVTLEDYTSIDAPESTRRADFSTVDKEGYVEEADRFVVQHRTAQANALYALTHSDQFPGIDKVTLQRYIDDAEPVIQYVVRQIRKCLDGSAKCETFVAPSLAVVVPPARTEGPPREELLATIARQKELWTNETTDNELQKRALEFCNFSIDRGPFPPVYVWDYCASALNRFRDRLGKQGFP